MKKLTNQQKIDLILEDLEGWLIQSGGDDGNSSLRYAFENGYHLHAASLWISSGAMDENLEKKVLPVKINRKKEMKEVNHLLENADIYVCTDCNHHQFFERSVGGYGDSVDEIDCPCCFEGTAIRED